MAMHMQFGHLRSHHGESARFLGATGTVTSQPVKSPVLASSEWVKRPGTFSSDLLFQPHKHYAVLNSEVISWVSSSSSFPDHISYPSS
uniref:Uncharacterized protein n=1 Tax=Oryza sativa subsp. japonica TaxID=39947 RepID=Q6AVH6_ORYSJ|nr:hypothetical protein [Oryza sativa Japonica Group]